MFKRLNESVTVWVQGGLGNQLFQWNAGIHASRNIGAPLLLSPASYRRDKLRTMVLESVIPRAILTSVVEDAAIGRPFDRSGRLRDKTGILGLPIVESWQEVTAPGRVLLGFFQDEESLQLDTSGVVNSLQPMRKSLGETRLGARVAGRVAVHVRRGDYVTAPGAIRAFGSISERYYRDSLDFLGGDISDAIFFTDDPDYVVETFQVERSNVVGPKDTSTDLESMMLMSLASALVIPNSTFSWWAAESMGTAASVVSPEAWFVDERRGEKVARSSWTKIPN